MTGAVPDLAALAARIDHTLLSPQATEAMLREHCAQARSYGFAAVCAQVQLQIIAVAHQRARTFGV